MAEFVFKTIKNSTWNFTGFLLSTVIGLILIPIVIKKIGIDHYGLYVLIITIMGPLGLAEMGFGSATIKYVAQYSASSEWKKVGQFIQTTLFMNISLGVVLCILFVVFGPSIFLSFFDVKVSDITLIRTSLYLAAFGWLISFIKSILIKIPVALCEYRKLTIGTIIMDSINYAIIFSFILIGMGLVGFIAAIAIGHLISMFYWFFICKKLLPTVSLRPKLNREAWKRSFSFGIWQTLGNIGGMITNQSEKVLLGIYLSPSSVGIFNASAALEQKGYTLVSKLSEVLFPTFSAITVSTSLETKASLLMRSSWLLNAISICILVPIIPLSESILTIWINSEIASKGAIILQAVCVAGVIGGASNAIIPFLLSEGYTKWIMIVSLASGIATVTTAAILLPIYGLAAAGFGGIMGMIIQRIILDLFIKKKFGKNLPFLRLLTRLYLPILIGLIIGFCASFISFLTVPKLVNVICGYAALSIIIGTTILIMNKILPYGQESNQDVVAIVEKIINKIVTNQFLKK